MFSDLTSPRPSDAFVTELAARPALFRLLELARPVIVTGPGAGDRLVIVAGIETWATAWALASMLRRRIPLHGLLVGAQSEPDTQAAWCLVACTAARIPTTPGVIAHLTLPLLADRAGSHRGVRRRHLADLLGMSRQGLWKAARRRGFCLPVAPDRGPEQSRRSTVAATSELQ